MLDINTKISEIEPQTNGIKISDDSFEYTLENAFNRIMGAVIVSDYVELQRVLSFSEAQSSIFDFMVKEMKIIYESNLKEEIITPYEKDMPVITPYFDYDEYINKNRAIDPDLTDIAASPYDYAFLDDPDGYMNKIKDLQILYSDTKDNRVRDALIKCGWDPEVAVNSESIKIARDKQLKWFRENKDVDIIHLEDYITANEVEYNDSRLTDDIDSISEAREANKGKVLEPIYIVLQYTGSTFGKLVNWWTKADWSHAGLSFDSNLDRVYSFNAHHYFRHGETNKLGGFSIESIKDWMNESYENAKIAVLAIFVPTKTKRKMLKNLEFWKSHKNETRYGYGNLLNIMTNRATKTDNYSLAMVCSQFVDNVLKLSNIDITDKNSNLVNPGDFMRIAREEDPNKKVRIYELYNGFAKDYSPKIIRQKIEVLKHKLSYNKMLVFDPKKVRLEVCDLDNMSPAMVELVRPMSICTEYKLPFSFDKTGNLTIALPKDLQREYNEAHRLLSMYDVSNIDAIKHELARLFYINTIIEYKLKKTKKGTKEYKELEDLRARVLNDFSTYFKVVKAADRKFDFNTYFAETEYYTKTIEIDNDTIAYSSKIIKGLLKTMTK